MRNLPVTLQCLAAAFLLATAQAQPAAVDPANVAFGYTDSTGSKLLALAEDPTPVAADRASTMTTAVCSEGRAFPIRYDGLQKRTAASNGRQTAGNFENEEGQLFRIEQGAAEPDDTCLLVPAGYLKSFPISRNEFPKSAREQRKDGFVPASATPQVSRIESAKGRMAKLYWLLHRSSAAQEVAVVEFRPVGDSLLGSLVLVEPSRLSFFDMPASLKEGQKNGGCWRVDDDCQFNQEGMNVPAVLGAPGRELIFFTTSGFEGLLIVLFQAKDGKLIELRRGYRYHAAI